MARVPAPGAGAPAPAPGTEVAAPGAPGTPDAGAPAPGADPVAAVPRPRPAPAPGGRVIFFVKNEASDPLDVWAVPTSSSANRAAAFVVRLAPGNETSQLATFGDAFALRRGDAWHLIAETFLTHSEPVAPALALRSRMQEAFSVTHALAPPRQVPPGGAEGWRLQHGEHLLLRDAADNLVASLALDKPKRESHDEI